MSHYYSTLPNRWVMRFLCLIIISFTSNTYAAPSPYAETVILNGEVITSDSDDPSQVSIVEAIAIQGDRIMAVGSNSEIRLLIAGWTEVIDAKGLTVIPGILDIHKHIYSSVGGAPRIYENIPELLGLSVRGETVEELTNNLEQAVRARASQIPNGWYIDVNLNPAEVAVAAFGNAITRDFLDRVAPNNPVTVSTRGGSVLNTLSIEAFEAYYGSEMSDDYWIVDRELGWSGEYTDFGRCSTIDLIGTKPGNFDFYIKGFFDILQGYAQTGVTTHKTHIQCEGGFSASAHMDRNDLLPIRFAWENRWWQPFNPRIAETYRRIGDSTGQGSDFMWSNGSSVGGIDAGGIGWCTSMPADEDIKAREQCPPAPEGVDLPYITETNTVSNRARRTEHLSTLAQLAAEGRITGIPGWHTSGDGSVDVLMETYRAVMPEDRIRQLRIESDHCHTVRPDQIELAARLGHTFACDISGTPTRVIKEGYGDEYLAWTTPMGSMLRAGVNAVVTEFSSSDSSPFRDGEMWLTGMTGDDEPWGVPENRVPDKMTLLLMMTRYPAYPIWRRDKLGSLEPGKLADVVILNGDYLDTPDENLGELVSIMTMIGGKISFEDPMLRGNTLRLDQDTAEWTMQMNTPTDIWRWDVPPQLPPFLNGRVDQ